jgi:glycosyltransferase involved in cell wall biosynthesis
VVYATYNEEANLARSLDSIRDLADELIVVDGSSTDRTQEIAQEYGARVINTTNKPIFHINKQMAMDEAKGDWTLQMDADEVVDEAMQRDIERILDADPASQPAGFWLRRKNWFLGRFLTKGGQYPDPVIRFYQTGRAKLPMKSVHEQMLLEGEVGTLAGHLLHYNSPSFSDYLRKANTYTTLTALEMEKAKVPLNTRSFVKYCLWLPKKTFFLLYFRHKGFQDGFPGFIFALFSGLHHFLAYIKYVELRRP